MIFYKPSSDNYMLFVGFPIPLFLLREIINFEFEKKINNNTVQYLALENSLAKPLCIGIEFNIIDLNRSKD